MKVNKLHPRFGLEVSDFDIRRTDSISVSNIRMMLEEHGLLVFRNQLPEDEDLLRFSTSIGNGRLDKSARKVAHSPSCPGVNYLTNLLDENGKPLGFGGNDTDFWHSDQEYRTSPATLSTLYCLIPAPEGGMTSFASTTLQNVSLSADIVPQLRGLRSTRRPAGTHDNVEHIEVSHPAILMSPRSRKEMVYVSEHTIRFLNIDVHTGQSLKKTVLENILVEENIYRHEWRFGDLLLYDNAQFLHRRESFAGIRWLKATKIFAPVDHFAVPSGEVVAEEKT